MHRRNFPEPQAICPASGFKVPHRELVRQWDGEYVARRFVDKRNPQDLIRARPERPTLPHPRPEPDDTFLATNVLDANGRPTIDENGDPVMTAGQLNGTGL